MTEPGVPFLSAQNVHRSFNSRVVLQGVSFELDRGEVLAVFGPNGAGKTTLLRTVAGALQPHQGTIRMEGRDQADMGRGWFRRIGYVSHATYLYGRLTAAENLTFYGRLFGLSDVPERVARRLEAVGLTDRAATLTRDLSRGLTQRLAIARALIHDPDLVLLDEPFAGLDAAAARRLASDLEHLRDGRRAVLLVTHDLRQGGALADRCAVLSRGSFRTMSVDSANTESFELEYHRLLESVA